MQPLDVLATIAELVSWVGLPFGVLALIAYVAARLADGTWTEVDIVVIHDGRGATARWFAEDEFHERHLSDDEREHLGETDAATAYTRIGSADRLRFDRHRPVVSVLGLAAAILLALGIAGFVLGIVLLFVG